MRIALIGLMLATLASGALGAGAGEPPALLDGLAEARYAEAARLYEQRSYAEAEAAFRGLLEDGGGHPVVLLGLGNSAYRRGDWVGAVYAYEWGLRLLPGDDSLAANLALARTHLVADVFPSPQSESARRATAALARVPGRWTLIAGLVAWTLGFCVLAARQLGRLDGWTWLGLSLVLLAVPAFAHAAWQHHRVAGRLEGVLQEDEVDVRSGPGAEYQVLFELHAGTVVRAQERRGDWWRVGLPNAAEGWVRLEDLALFGDVATLLPR